MKKTAVLISSALVLAFGLAGVASAHDGRGDGPRGARMERMFERFDTDNDGKITETEIEGAAEARFAEADTDGDGFLTAAEMAAAAEARRANRVGRMLERLDTDGDGKLSLAEMTAMRDSRGPDRMFERLDEDGDGAISREELADARGMMRGRHGAGHWMGDR